MRKRAGIKWIALLLFLVCILFGTSLDASAGSIDRKKYKAFEREMQNAIRNFKSSVDISSCGISTSDIVKYNHQFIWENPRYFYGSACMYYGFPGQAVQYQTLKYISNAKTVKTKYEKKVASIMKQVNKKWTNYEKALFLHDYLALTVDYSLEGKWKVHAYDPYGAIVNGKAVCSGYARAYKDLMDRAGVPCEYIASDKQLDHAWNLVKIKGEWYHVDVTWDDPYGNMKGNASHNYFLKSYKWFAANRHRATDFVITGGLKATSAQSTKYDDESWEDSTRAFHYYKGKWYTGANPSTGEISCYAFRKATGMMVKKGTIATVTDKWMDWESGYNDAYYNTAGLIYKGRFYYNTPNRIYYYDLKSGKTVLVHTDNTPEFNIYEMEVKNGKLIYYLRKRYYADEVKKMTIKL